MSSWYYDAKTGRHTSDSSPTVLVGVSCLVGLTLYKTCGARVALTFAIVTTAMVAGGWVSRRRLAWLAGRLNTGGKA
ncbi:MULTISPECIES: hypothetical protein [unclassified Paraburkholderia]|uniref:hypothetical protein n=1 Tax=unclassified Paraburkholderia TaxID=2615204 RepID=UPI002AB19960|nr:MULTISPECIES: hypothetical protein [unclassified Paraburkholderia]